MWGGGGVVWGFPCLCQSAAKPSIKSVFYGAKELNHKSRGRILRA